MNYVHIWYIAIWHKVFFFLNNCKDGTVLYCWLADQKSNQGSIYKPRNSIKLIYSWFQIHRQEDSAKHMNQWWRRDLPIVRVRTPWAQKKIHDFSIISPWPCSVFPGLVHWWFWHNLKLHQHVKLHFLASN